jgi:hypothetical protein
MLIKVSLHNNGLVTQLRKGIAELENKPSNENRTWLNIKQQQLETAVSIQHIIEYQKRQSIQEKISGLTEFINDSRVNNAVCTKEFDKKMNEYLSILDDGSATKKESAQIIREHLGHSSRLWSSGMKKLAHQALDCLTQDNRSVRKP